jgi:hypothetical protein
MNSKGMMNKNGQFFLIAAITIIIVIVSVVTITNYTEKKNEVKLYDLKQEMGIESQQVLDYGTYNNLNSSQMKTLMENFINNYVNYIEDEKNIYFIFGNRNEINALGYQEINNESVCITLNPSYHSYWGYGEEDECIPLQMEATQSFPATSGAIDVVVIRIEDNEYQFRLRAGENFYFVIWQKIAGEKEVVSSSG